MFWDTLYTNGMPTKGREILQVMEAPRGVLRENRRRDGDVEREKYHHLFLPLSCDTCERISCSQPLHYRRHRVMIPLNNNQFLASTIFALNLSVIN